MAVNLEHSNDYSFSPHNPKGVWIAQGSARWYAKRKCRSSTPSLAQEIKMAEFYNYSKFCAFFFFRINLYNCSVAFNFHKHISQPRFLVIRVRHHFIKDVKMAVNLEHSNDYSFSPHNPKGVWIAQGSARWYAKRKCRSSTPRLAQEIKMAEFYNYSKFCAFFFFRINLYNCLVAFNFHKHISQPRFSYTSSSSFH